MDLISVLKNHQHEMHPVVPFEKEKDKLMRFDFTEANTALSEDVYVNTDLFSNWVSSRLKRNNARYGIGGYNELRKIYSRSRAFDATELSVEPRRLHLGVDIWGPCNTPVIAPLNGIIHSFAFNNHFGDYGVTIILSHYLDGFSFYTLYGHLSLNSIKNLQEGLMITKGQVFAETGMQFENGHWPPHLHIQIIKNLEGWSGDYPGVCKFSEREKYLINCPDPDLILQLNQDVSD